MDLQCFKCKLYTVTAPHFAEQSQVHAFPPTSQPVHFENSLIEIPFCYAKKQFTLQTPQSSADFVLNIDGNAVYLFFEGGFELTYFTATFKKYHLLQGSDTKSFSNSGFLLTLVVNVLG